MKTFLGAGSAQSGPSAYAAAALAVALVTGATSLMLGHLDLVNIAMVFPLAVLYAAVRLGRGPAVLAAFLSVALFDFFFVPPHFTLEVSDLQYLVTFAVLLIVALITAELAAGLRAQRDAAQRREAKVRALYEMAAELSAALSVEQVAEIADRLGPRTIGAKVGLLLPAGAGGLRNPLRQDEAPTPQLAESVRQAIREETLREIPATASGGRIAIIPLRAPVGVRGALLTDASVAIDDPAAAQALAHLVAISVERIHYIEVARQSEVDMASERLRNSLLAALSHDIRTPLTALVGLSETLAITGPSLSADQLELVDGIRDEAVRTSALVNNLLEMARLQSGGVRLRREWLPVEEVVGAALQSRARQLTAHRVTLDLPPDLPLVSLDPVLMERALCNLIENAAKFTPPGGEIAIRARIGGDLLRLEIADSGPGLRPEQEFERLAPFRRDGTGRAESDSGLGLAIVETIVAAHEGHVEAHNRPAGGAVFVITLALGTPPSTPGEAE